MKIYYLNTNNLTAKQIEQMYLNAEAYRKIRYDNTQDKVAKIECIASDALIKYGTKNYISDQNIIPKTDYLESGKLVFTNIPLYLCITHTHGHAFLAIHDKNVGIDAELIRNISYTQLHNRFFFNINPHPQNGIDFFKEWTATEACFKLENKKNLMLNYEYTTPVNSFCYKQFVISVASSDPEIDLTNQCIISEIIPEDL